MTPTYAPISLVFLAACAAARPVPVAGEGANLPVDDPSIVLSQPHMATVLGQTVSFDGDAESLAWPALGRAFVRPTGGARPVVVAVGRQEPFVDVLRVGWMLRAGDVSIVAKDAHDIPHVVLFRAKPASSTPGCHVALFVREGGAIRLAGPNGSQIVEGDDATTRIVHEIADESARCPMRFVAFGAESRAAAWDAVFDVILAVDATKAAGEARYVLAEPERAAR